MKIKCDFEYCLHNEKYTCTLDNISIDALGMCGDCIMVNFDKELLESEKAKQLRKLMK